MARLKNRDDLGDVGGRLSQAFRAATLTALQAAFLSAAPPAEKTAAAQALNQFHQAARKLHLSENAFNQRARPAVGDKPSLLVHLRSREQFAALRDFSAARENLLGFSPIIGQRIVRLAEQGTDTPVPHHSRASAPAAAL